MTSKAGIHVLVLTADPSLLSKFREVSKVLGIETDSGRDSHDFLYQLSHCKYEGVVLDFDTIPAATPVLDSVRKSRPNQNAVVFAVATGTKARDQALEDGAHFLLQRPIQSEELRRTLHAAYDLMQVERRHYFRFTAELPVLLTSTSGNNVQCVTMNVSSNGIAVKTPAPFKLAETLDIELSLPNGFIVLATGIVTWGDKHGKSGMRLQCRGPEMRHKLDSWLDSQFSSVRR